MRKIVITYGIISGALLGAMLAGTQFLHEDIGFGIAGMILGYTTMVLAFLLIYYGIRSYRDTVADGRVGFGKACLIGGLIFAISSAGYVGTWMVIDARAGGTFMERYAAHMVAEERAKGTPEAEIATKQQELAQFAEQYKNPFYKAAVTFLEPLPIGLLMTLGSAWLLSRRRAPA
ncbi:MAG: DUF4199 domain-containing protein [Gemmatimonadetes bacterium]|nr:DUF4199 domain-containing protein [Gemmatimonadota bacterium]